MILLYAISYWSYLIILSTNTFLYSIRKKRKSDRWLKAISGYLWGMLVIQIVSDVVSYYTSDNLYISHIYFYTQMLLLALFYYQILKRPKQRKFIKLYLFFTSVVIFIQYIILPSLWVRFNLLEVCLTNYFLIVCCLLYYYNTLSKKRYFFYLNLGILVYSTLSTSFFLLGNVLADMNHSISVYTWGLHAVTSIFFQVMILVQWFKSFSKNQADV